MENEKKLKLPDEKTLHRQYLEELKKTLGIRNIDTEPLTVSQEELPELGRWIEDV